MEISPGKDIRFPLIAAASTQLGWLPTRFDPVTPDGMLPYAPNPASYAIPVRRYQLLQSRFLQTGGRPPRPCPAFPEKRD